VAKRAELRHADDGANSKVNGFWDTGISGPAAEKLKVVQHALKQAGLEKKLEPYGINFD